MRSCTVQPLFVGSTCIPFMAAIGGSGLFAVCEFCHAKEGVAPTEEEEEDHGNRESRRRGSAFSFFPVFWRKP